MRERYMLNLKYPYKEGNAGQLPIDGAVLQNMLLQLGGGEETCEKGGILGLGKAGIITHFYYDTRGICDRNTYYPHAASLQQVIRTWKRCGVSFVGMIHTHSGKNARYLSSGDLDFVRSMLGANPHMERFLMIVVADKMTAFCFEQDFTQERYKEETYDQMCHDR